METTSVISETTAALTQSTVHIGSATPWIVMGIVLAIIAAFVIIGYCKGILVILFSFCSILVTIILSLLLTQPVASFLQNNTSVGTSVKESIYNYMDSSTSASTSEVSDEAESVKTAASDDEMINKLALPSFIKTSLIDNNTVENYVEMGVTTFKEYIATALSSVIIKAITFLALLVLIFVALRILLHIAKLVNKIPVLRGINRFLGAVLGLIEGLLIIWIISVLIMAFSSSAFGTTAIAVIHANGVLTFLYDNNLLVMGAKMVFGI